VASCRRGTSNECAEKCAGRTVTFITIDIHHSRIARNRSLTHSRQYRQGFTDRQRPSFVAGSGTANARRVTRSRTLIPVAEKSQPDRRLRRVFAVRNWLSTVSGRFHVTWRPSLDRKPKACAHACVPNAHAFGLRSNDGMFCGGILFDPRRRREPRWTATASRHTPGKNAQPSRTCRARMPNPRGVMTAPLYGWRTAGATAETAVSSAFTRRPASRGSRPYR